MEITLGNLFEFETVGTNTQGAAQRPTKHTKTLVCSQAACVNIKSVMASAFQHRSQGTHRTCVHTHEGSTPSCHAVHMQGQQGAHYHYRRCGVSSKAGLHALPQRLRRGYSCQRPLYDDRWHNTSVFTGSSATINIVMITSSSTLANCAHTRVRQGMPTTRMPSCAHARAHHHHRGCG